MSQRLTGPPSPMLLKEWIPSASRRKPLSAASRPGWLGGTCRWVLNEQFGSTISRLHDLEEKTPGWNVMVQALESSPPDWPATIKFDSGESRSTYWSRD